MKNRMLVTAGIIVVLLAAVALKKYCCRSSVPALEGWYEPADRIVIKSSKGTITLTRKDTVWTIGEGGFAGDAALIEGLERKARDFKLLDLVSEKGYYDRYDLTEGKCVTVTLEGGGKLLRKILIGKSGGSGNHSYIRVDGRSGIYLASGITQSDFMLPVPDLRDKVICNIKADEVKSFTVAFEGKNYIFKLNPGAETDGSKDNRGAKSSRWECIGCGNITLNDASVNSLLSLFSPLKAAEFPEITDKKVAGKPICTVKLLVADRTVTLDIFSGKSEGMYYASSSESRYIFTIGSWQAEKLFIKNIKDLAVK